MESRFPLKEADLVSAHWTYTKRHWWRFLSRHKRAAEIALASLAIVTLHPETRRVSAWILLAALVPVVGVILRYRWTWHREFQDYGERIISATVDGESIRLRGRRDVVRRWNEIAYVDESRRVFLFGTVNGSVLFLPRAALSHAQLAELRLLILTNAKGKTKLASD